MNKPHAHTDDSTSPALPESSVKSRFADNLKTLPPIDHLARLELYGKEPVPVAVIENKPGQLGSLAIYYKVAVDFGGISPNAARQALDLYAEKVAEAEANPGQHPNIDRLFQIIADRQYLAVKTIAKA